MRTLIFALVLGWACGAQAQWALQASGTTAGLRGIDSLGAGVAWASGTKGTVLRTVDDGAHWQHCAVPPGGEELDFRAVQAFDKDTALVMSVGPGALSELYKTSDGCKSWRLLFTDAEGFWMRCASIARPSMTSATV